MNRNHRQLRAVVVGWPAASRRSGGEGRYHTHGAHSPAKTAPRGGQFAGGAAWR